MPSSSHSLARHMANAQPPAAGQAARNAPWFIVCKHEPERREDTFVLMFEGGLETVFERADAWPFPSHGLAQRIANELSASYGARGMQFKVVGS